MKALGASYLKFFVSKHREIKIERVGFDFGFLVYQKRVGDGLLSFKPKCTLASISPALTGLESEEIQSANTDHHKTVQVRFKLHKYCEFGQRFLVVGDDPSLGSWDPSDGVPLNWSQGHVWTALVDIPCSKVINYKFILEDINGTISWQPGTNRVIETWETANTILVTEDWDFAEFQIIDEEEVVNELNDPFLNDSALLIADKFNHILMKEEGPVLVPGLSTEVEAEAISIVGSTRTDVFDEVKDSADPNQRRISIVGDIAAKAATNHEIRVSTSLHYAERSGLMAVEENPWLNWMESSILSRDLLWGRQTLHKFLANLGFMQPSN